MNSPAARQADATATVEWLTVNEAAERTGQPLRTWQWRCRSLVARGLAARQRRGHRWQWLVHPAALAGDALPEEDSADRAARLAGCSPEQIARGRRKLEYLRQWEQAGRTPEATRRAIRAARQADPELRISARSLQRWPVT